ncbi:hypothetical protein [Pyrobaculum ferrireducens]|uniref:Uncharacterized protein n=1 Tax=Pyrobaculum ferrireducens TaxID=1104324 RepID=G7VF52_9CREN|nr:hypothetical protein [Pyrobaculum ferrireducens]AET31668.1 hypothetical protein P186_0207 [Pyrobaculum ferrireducens]
MDMLQRGLGLKSLVVLLWRASAVGLVSLPQVVAAWLAGCRVLFRWRVFGCGYV